MTIQSGGWGSAIRSQAGKDTTFTGKDGASVVTASGLQEALRWGNVTVISEGDIVVEASLIWSGNSRLTLNARRSIVVRKGATIANRGAGSLALRAGIVTLDGTVDYAGSTGKVSILAGGESGTTNSLKSAYASSVLTNRAVADQLLVAATSSPITTPGLRDPLHPANAPQRKASNEPRRRADNPTASVWVTSSLVKVHADAAADTPQSVQISAARNEFESFQVHVRAGSTPVALSVTVGDFVNQQTGAIISSATNVFVHRAAFMNITTLSDQNGTTGLTPDPLIPAKDPYFNETRNAFPFTVPVNTVQSAWIDVLVPATAVSGFYSASVTVMDGASVLGTLSVTLKVWNFVLPSTATLKSAFSMSYRSLCAVAYSDYNSCKTYPGSGDSSDHGIELMNLAHAALFLDHRVTISAVVNYAPPVGDWSHFDSIYTGLLDGNAAATPSGAPPTLLAGAKLTSLNMYHSANYTAAANIQDWVDHFSTKGWLGALFDYTCDEPHLTGDPNIPVCQTYQEAKDKAAAVHAGSAAMKTLVTTNIDQATQFPSPGDNLLAQLNIITPVVNDLDPQGGSNLRSTYTSWLAGGSDRHLWWYQACSSHGSCANGIVGPATATWPSYMIDATPVRNRVFQWLAFINNIEGELYYGTDLCWIGANCNTSDAWATVYNYGGNGDGTMAYPGTTTDSNKNSYIGGSTPIPVASVRLKHIRDGMEDFEYLNALSRLGDDAFARTTAAGFIDNAYTFTNNPQALTDAREALGDRLHQLSQSLRCPQDAKICSNGTRAQRAAPFCDFTPCP